MHLDAWAQRWGVPLEAMAELLRLGGPWVPQPTPQHPSPAGIEADAQNRVRIEASRLGMRLWRNNVGVLEDARGRPVRFGLANDSAAVNRVMKSSDLIGVRPVRVGPEHVGTLLGQFVAREVKRPGWRYSGNEHEVAQAAFITLVNALGGDAMFCTGEGTL